MAEELDLMTKILSLCKRRGFFFQSSEIYGGLKSAYDYGPLGVELKRNIAQEWWRSMVHEREDVVGLDASIFMRPEVWKTSGHVDGFSDPLVDCRNCKERFRADKAPRLDPGTEVKYIKGGAKKGETIAGRVSERGYVCPKCGGADLSEERQFNLMFRTTIGPVDPLDAVLDEVHGTVVDRKVLREKMQQALQASTIYLRPETAQAIFVQFLNVQQSLGMKVPFGVAQIGKSFRNEITTEHSIFRTVEFEQMEMEFFVEPGTQENWLKEWREARIQWWQRYANGKDKFRLRQHAPDERAHYADDCYDVEYNYPWGWGELEGIASRTDYDLAKHSAASNTKLSYFDPNRNDPATGKPGWRFTPYVIEPAAGLTRAVLLYLLDAYNEEKGVDADGAEKTRVVLKLHPRFAPFKVAVCPLMKKEGMPEVAREIVKQFYQSGIHASYDEQQSIGKRYARHDEIGTPYCITVDHQSLTDKMVTIRDRDTTKQDRIAIPEAVDTVRRRVFGDVA